MRRSCSHCGSPIADSATGATCPACEAALRPPSVTGAPWTAPTGASESARSPWNAPPGDVADAPWAKSPVLPGSAPAVAPDDAAAPPGPPSGTSAPPQAPAPGPATPARGGVFSAEFSLGDLGDERPSPPVAGPRPAPPRAQGPNVALFLILALSLLGVGGAVLAFQVTRAQQVEDEPASATLEEGALEARAPANPLDEWDGTSDLFCRAGQRLEFRNVAGKARVHAMDDCQLTLIDCEVGGYDTTVSARDEAVVTIEKGTISGRSEAFSVRGRARVTVRATKVVAGRTAAIVDDEAVLMLYGAKVERDASVPTESLSFPPRAFRVGESGQLGMDGGHVHWLADGVSAARNAVVVLRDVELETSLWSRARSPGTALQVGGSTTAIVVGGSIRSEEVAVEVNDLAHLTLHGTTVTGKTKEEPGTTVERLEQGGTSDIAQAMRELLPVREQLRQEFEAHQRIGGHACDGVDVCVNEVELRGQVKGQIVTLVDATGAIGSITANGSFQGPVLACVRRRHQGRSIDGYVGGPGRLVCSWDVTISQGGGQMGSWGSDFERLESKHGPR